MKDYNEMSDFEINRLVAIKLGHKSYHEDGSYTNDGRNVTVKGNGILGWFNPCNNPEDMWPLIVENNIWIQPDMVGDGYWHSHCEDFLAKDKNPLRSAAIIYLMIKDAE